MSIVKGAGSVVSTFPSFTVYFECQYVTGSPSIIFSAFSVLSSLDALIFQVDFSGTVSTKGSFAASLADAISAGLIRSISAQVPTPPDATVLVKIILTPERLTASQLKVSIVSSPTNVPFARSFP